MNLKKEISVKLVLTKMKINAQIGGVLIGMIEKKFFEFDINLL